MKNLKQDNENVDQIVYKPDEQLLKEDLVVKYKTIIEFNKIPDVEFQKNLSDIDSSSLLYSPFELYTNFRIRNQIYLIIDTIQSLKAAFNKEFRLFILERNTILEKFNANKQAIENIKEFLGNDVFVENYSYMLNQHEDNEWVNKIDDHDITIAKYFSREEKMQMEEDKRKEEERLKALQGDTLEMRGLNYMIEHKALKSKQNKDEENELVREPFMDKKKKEEMTDEEIKKYNEYIKKEKELQDKKEKIRSQNLTKLNSHKMEIENLKADLDSKFLKIYKKKLFYDYRVTEQELYILALLKTMEFREEIKNKTAEMKSKFTKAKDDEEKMNQIKQEFESNLSSFNSKYQKYLELYSEKNKNNKMLETLERSLFENFELNTQDKEYLQKIRTDPFYFVEREKVRNVKKYGNKAYKEIKTVQRSNQEENVGIINNKYYVKFIFNVLV